MHEKPFGNLFQTEIHCNNTFIKIVFQLYFVMKLSLGNFFQLTVCNDKMRYAVNSELKQDVSDTDNDFS